MEKIINLEGRQMTINLRRNIKAKGNAPVAFVDLDDGIMKNYSLPAFVKEGKLQIGDKLQYKMGKSTGFKETHFVDRDIHDKINMAATELWLIQRETEK